MEVRRVAGDDIKRASEISTIAFNVEVGSWAEEWYFLEKTTGPNAIWGVFEGAQMVAACVAPPQQVWFGDNLTEGAYVGGVATHPEHRRKGYAEAMMREVARWQRASGRLISYLWPFSYRYYRKLGWEMAGDSIRISAPRKTVASWERNYETRDLLISDMPDLITLWTEFANKYNGCGVRSWERWVRTITSRREFSFEPQDTLFLKGTRAFGCWMDGEIAGYAQWAIPEAPNTELSILEIAFTNVTAARCLISAAAETSPSVDTVSWETAMDGPLHLMTNEATDFTRAVAPGFSGRVLDPERFLQSMTWVMEARGNLSLKIHDPVFGETKVNLDIESGRSTVSKHEGQQLECSTQTLTQVATGYLTPEQAVALGGISESQLGAARLLARAGGGRCPYRSRQEPG